MVTDQILTCNSGITTGASPPRGQKLTSTYKAVTQVTGDMDVQFPRNLIKISLQFFPSFKNFPPLLYIFLYKSR